jgi:hypothetical protein
MEGQARSSGLVMGFDNPMIAGNRACSTFSRPAHPNITNQTSPHYAEALVGPHSREVAATSLQRLVESVEEFDDDFVGHDDIAEPPPSPSWVCVQARDLGSLLSYLPDGFWIPAIRSQPLDLGIGSGLEVLLLESLHFRGEFHVFGCVSAEAAVRHGLEDVELGGDAGG